MIKLFLVAYLQLLLLTIHSRLANRCQYVGMVITSITVGILYTSTFRQLMASIDDPLAIASYITGTTLGGITGAWLHNKYSKEKK